jgi:hypothetical protein
LEELKQLISTAQQQAVVAERIAHEAKALASKTDGSNLEQTLAAMSDKLQNAARSESPERPIGLDRSQSEAILAEGVQAAKGEVDSRFRQFREEISEELRKKIDKKVVDKLKAQLDASEKLVRGLVSQVDTLRTDVDGMPSTSVEARSPGAMDRAQFDSLATTVMVHSQKLSQLLDDPTRANSGMWQRLESLRQAVDHLPSMHRQIADVLHDVEALHRMMDAKASAADLAHLSSHVSSMLDNSLSLRNTRPMSNDRLVTTNSKCILCGDFEKSRPMAKEQAAVRRPRSHGSDGHGPSRAQLSSLMQSQRTPL